MTRIMIIEDDEMTRSLLKDFAEQEGHEACSSPNNSVAFERLAQERFDVVITGMQKPGLAGLYILPAIKNLQPGASLIFMRGFGNEGLCRPPSETGAAKHSAKPVYFDQLRKLIREIKEAPGREKTAKGIGRQNQRSYSSASMTGKQALPSLGISAAK